MKSTALRQLEHLAHEDHRRRYPSVPDHCRPRQKFSDSTAAGLTKAILRYLELRVHKAWRQSSEGRYRPGMQVTDVIGRVRQMKGTWLPGMHTGHGDISAIIHGRFISWELKVGKGDRQRRLQREFQNEVEQSGGKYFIVRSFAEFLTQYDSIRDQIGLKNIEKTTFREGL